jgi:hypothetical protein
MDKHSHMSLLINWMRWFNGLLLTIGGFFFIVFAVRSSPASLLFAIIITVIYFPLARYGLHKARQGKSNAALFSLTFVCWTLAIVVASRGSTALPVTLPLALVPMIISLPYISHRGLLGLAFGTLAVSIIATLLTLQGPMLPSNLEEATLSFIMLPLNAVIIGLAAFGLWKVGSRLRTVLSKTESMNAELAESERLLEQKVSERTSELEHALAEISDIEAITLTVNVTLDLDEVIKAIRSALQRVFKFDNISVFLLDEKCQCLMVDRVAGIDLQSQNPEGFLQDGIPLSEQHSILVYVLQNNESKLIPNIARENVQLMSPSDRWAHDSNPVKSVLVCPLEIEGKAIGVITFGRLHEPMQLASSEIDRIQRYVTPLATGIRNARLFEETRAARAEAEESNQAAIRLKASFWPI